MIDAASVGGTVGLGNTCSTPRMPSAFAEHSDRTRVLWVLPDRDHQPTIKVRLRASE
jgi:hypothetical protein